MPLILAEARTPASSGDLRGGPSRSASRQPRPDAPSWRRRVREDGQVTMAADLRARPVATPREPHPGACAAKIDDRKAAVQAGRECAQLLVSRSSPPHPEPPGALAPHLEPPDNLHVGEQ